MRARIAATRWPSSELVADRSQGVQSATTQELARYWETDYDSRRCQARLNASPQFKTEIDGVDTHFIHVKSPHANVLPLILTHGCPVRSSRCQRSSASGPTHLRTATAPDAFTSWCHPSPATVSAEPTELGWHSGRVAQAWAELMRRLGYSRYVPKSATKSLPTPTPSARSLGLPASTRTCSCRRWEAPPSRRGPTKRADLEAMAEFRATGFGYFLEQATCPQTIGYALLDSPVALAAWMIDHDTDSYYKISRAFSDKQPAGNLTRAHILDKITLY